MNSIHKNTMRRVYYAFAWRLASHPATVQLAVVGCAVWGLAQLVFVERVIDGFLDARVGDIVPHTMNVLANADTVTLLVFGVLVCSIVSVGTHLRSFQIAEYPPRQLST